MTARLPLVVKALVACLAVGMSAGPADAHGATATDPTALTLLTAWSWDPLPLLGVLIAGAAYVVAARRVNRSDPRVRISGAQVAFWFAGLAAIFIALTSAIDIYAEQLLSVHMVQHLLLAMVAPPLLALAAPVTLALRVASPEVRRGLLLPVLHSRALRVLASPVVAWVLFAAAMWLMHFSPVYNAALEDPLIHDLEHLVFLSVGMLFWWPVVAADPVPGRMGHGARLVFVGSQMPVNAAVGLAIYFAPAVLYPFYASIMRPWGPDAITDQQIGGVLMWGAGDVLLLAAIPVILVSWMRADVRRSARLDARLARQHADRASRQST
jgi:cytochrome c oxidase assembly factor CtaG